MATTDRKQPSMGNAAPLSEVTIVTVAYNSAGVLPRLLGSIPPGVPVVMVDNGISDDSADLAAKAGATVVRLAENEGFGRGCNAGAAVVATPFLFFVNPDARLEPECIDALLEAVARYPDASAFNPRIVNPSGRVELKRRSALLPRSEWLRGVTPADDQQLPALTGGALFVRRDCFEQVGGFDPAIFLYHEDDDLSIRLRRDCGPLYFIHDAVVQHDAGHSSGRSPTVARFKGLHMARSRVYAMAKHGRPFGLARTLGSALLNLILPHNLLSARRRAKHLGLVAGAWSARRDGGAYR